MINTPRLITSSLQLLFSRSLWVVSTAGCTKMFIHGKFGLKIFLASTLTTHHHLRSRPTHSSVTEASISKPHRRPLRDAKGASIWRSHHRLHSRRSRQCMRAGSTSMTLHHLRKPLQGKFSWIYMRLALPTSKSKKKNSVQRMTQNQAEMCREQALSYKGENALQVMCEESKQVIFGR
jgi:hypothetical protein